MLSYVGKAGGLNRKQLMCQPNHLTQHLHRCTVYNMTATILTIPPKTRHGTRRNAKWITQYDKSTAKWTWRVEVTVAPQVFTGTEPTEAKAMQQINEILDRSV